MCLACVCLYVCLYAGILTMHSSFTQQRSPDADVGFQKCSPCSAFSVQSGTIRIGRRALLADAERLQ